jgi:hypothetical protein
VADPIALVLTAREGEPSLLDGADLRVLRIAGLDRSDAARLLAPTEVPNDAIERLHRATAGNPLALLEIDDLAAAEEAGLVTIDLGQVEFRHPLARAAMYASASPKERREAHAALAAVLGDRELARRAWHLAAATVGPDDHACRALGQAGTRARQRSAYAVAAAAFERGARLAVSDASRAQLLFDAGEAAWLAGDWHRTTSLLDQAQLHAADPQLGARISHL